MENFGTIAAWAAFGVQAAGFAFWLGAMGQRVKTLEDAKKEEPTLHQIHLELTGLKATIEHWANLMEAPQIKPPRAR